MVIRQKSLICKEKSNQDVDVFDTFLKNELMFT